MNFFKTSGRCTVLFVLFAFILTSLMSPAYAQVVFDLPQAGEMIGLSGAYAPVVLKGVAIHPEDPLLFDFIVDIGNADLKGRALTAETTKLVKYFLTGLAVPEKELWVNLSPVEKDRIMADPLSHTDAGRDMLAQDYILKQVTSSLMYPEKDLGRRFWDEIYRRVYAKYGAAHVPVDTFNKVWIMPDEAEVYQHDGNAFITKAHLKVMLEADYDAVRGVVTGAEEKEKGATIELARDVVRELILPVLEKEVNEGRNFASLRQIFNSLILAGWFKHALKDSLLDQVYVGTNKVDGIDIADKDARERVYARYIEAYQKGVYNYVKDEFDRSVKEIVPRKYFSGGAKWDKAMAPQITADSSQVKSGNYQARSYRLQEIGDMSQNSREDSARRRRAGILHEAVVKVLGLSDKLSGYYSSRQDFIHLIRFSSALMRSNRDMSLDDVVDVTADVTRRANEKDSMNESLEYLQAAEILADAGYSGGDIVGMTEELWSAFIDEKNAYDKWWINDQTYAGPGMLRVAARWEALDSNRTLTSSKAMNFAGTLFDLFLSQEYDPLWLAEQEEKGRKILLEAQMEAVLALIESKFKGSGEASLEKWVKRDEGPVGALVREVSAVTAFFYKWISYPVPLTMKAALHLYAAWKMRYPDVDKGVLMNRVVAFMERFKNEQYLQEVVLMAGVLVKAGWSEKDINAKTAKFLKDRPDDFPGIDEIAGVVFAYPVHFEDSLELIYSAADTFSGRINSLNKRFMDLDPEDKEVVAAYVKEALFAGAAWIKQSPGFEPVPDDSKDMSQGNDAGVSDKFRAFLRLKSINYLFGNNTGFAEKSGSSEREDKGGIDLGQDSYLKVAGSDAAGMPRFDPVLLLRLQKDLRGFIPIPAGSPAPVDLNLIFGLDRKPGPS